MTESADKASIGCCKSSEGAEGWALSNTWFHPALPTCQWSSDHSGSIFLLRTTDLLCFFYWGYHICALFFFWPKYLWLCPAGNKIQQWAFLRPSGLDCFNQDPSVTLPICRIEPGAMAGSLRMLHTLCWFLITLAQVHSTEGKTSDSVVSRAYPHPHPHPHPQSHPHAIWLLWPNAVTQYDAMRSWFMPELLLRAQAALVSDAAARTAGTGGRGIILSGFISW